VLKQACLISHLSVRLSVCLSVCPVGEFGKNGCLGQDAVWGGEWSRSRDGCFRLGTHPQGEGGGLGSFRPIGLNGVLGVFLKHKCIRLVRKKSWQYFRTDSISTECFFILLMMYFVTRSTLAFTIIFAKT